jgi:hypothetical protein
MGLYIYIYWYQWSNCYSVLDLQAEAWKARMARNSNFQTIRVGRNHTAMRAQTSATVVLFRRQRSITIAMTLWTIARRTAANNLLVRTRKPERSSNPPYTRQTRVVFYAKGSA